MRSSGKAYKHPETGSIISDDGLKVGYTKFGNGPSVVIVHGSYSVQENWFEFARLLADAYTVYVYDRRGRGKSLDDDNPFSFEMEVNDLAAIVHLAGDPVSIIAHSYGGAIALSYVLRVSFKGRIVFYEPMNGIFDAVSQGLLPELKLLVADGKLDEATVLTQTRIVGFDRSSVEASRRSPTWSTSTRMTKVFLRELEALDNLKPRSDETDKIQTKAFLLLGTESPHGIRKASAAVVARVRGITVYPVYNQGHMGHVLNPQQLSELVLQCFNEE